MNARASESGFSLIETLVSLAVISGMAGLLFETVATQVRSAHMLAQRREAVMLAQSLLAELTAAPDGMNLPEIGQWRDLTWRQTQHAIAGGARASGPQLEEVRIEIADRRSGRRLTRLRTLRLGR